MATLSTTGTRIDRRLSNLRERGRKGFIAYVTAGDPSFASTEDIVLRLEDAGADIIELGIPFSDPLADGRVNQQAAERALAGGATFKGVLDCVRAIRKRSDIPLLFFSYVNPLLARGFERAAREAHAAGVDGFLVLDLPAEEMPPFARMLREQALSNICLVTPTSTEARIRAITRMAGGFVYCVSREGVTGQQPQLSAHAASLVARTRRHTRLPLALGFGISTPEQAAAAARQADAVIVGSAIVERFAAEPDTARGHARAAAWCKTLIEAAHAS